MVQFVAVIDLGKTNSKVALVDTSTSTELEILKQPSAVDSTGLYPSLDHQAIKSFIFDSLKCFAKNHRIDAITVTTHGATAALITANGDLALPVLDYEYADIDELRPQYNLHRPSFEQTGSPALPGGLNIGAQLFWLQTKFPEQFAKAACVLTWPQYWVHVLTAERHNDVTSLGCHTDLYEPHYKRYSTLIDKMKWTSRMPPTRQSGQISNTLLPQIANELKLPISLPVHTGIHDSNASLVPHLVSHSSPFSVVSTGTWFIVMAIGGVPATLHERRDTLLNVNALGEPVPSARFMGGRERDLLDKHSQGSEDALKSLLSDINSAPMLMPSVVPNTGPYPNETHRWIEVEPPQGSPLRSCAIALYLALMTNECMHMVGCDGPTYIEGPLAQDQVYAQMLSVVSDRSVWISDSETGTSVGAAMLIEKPVRPPSYTSVTLDPSLRDPLQRYAIVWQKHLQKALS
ncbi:MAG: carbohydrate kinase [Gammaproteobacteria bacterium]|nr:carbohydrate kinase [Gammaproteobacteria bacterium]